MHIVKRFCRNILNSYWFLRIIEVFDRRSENRVTEFGMLAQAMEFAKINGVGGDYFEFGLWQGKTFKYAHKMIRRYSLKGIKLRGFDSFQGLPSHENRSDNIWRKGQFAYGRNLLERDLLGSRFKSTEYELVEGFYDNSLNEELVAKLSLAGVKAAVVYVDCDLYESTKPVLKFIVNFLQNGTIICFDDYYNYKGAKDEGEARAIAEFLLENPHVEFIPYMIYSPLGQSFITRIQPQ